VYLAEWQILTAYKTTGFSSTVEATLDIDAAGLSNCRSLTIDEASNFIAGQSNSPSLVRKFDGFTSTVLDSVSLASDSDGLTTNADNDLLQIGNAGLIIKFDGFSTTVLATIDMSANGPRWSGVTVDSDGNVLWCKWNTDTIYKLDGESTTILSSFEIAVDLLYGVTWDGEDLYSVDANEMFQHDGFSSTITNTVDLVAALGGTRWDCGIEWDSWSERLISTPPPVAAFSGMPLAGPAPLEVQFTDESTGDITEWFWDFGDGETSSEQNPTHEYNASGSYAVELEATGPGGSDTESKPDYITVYDPPVADFSATPLVTPVGSNIAFTDESTGNVNSWLWDFGDGNTSTDQNPVHAYTDGAFVGDFGVFTVTLTVTGYGGQDQKVRTDYITIYEVPTADFVASPREGFVTLPVDFVSSTTGVINSYLWEFGDGETSTEANPAHDYTSPGTYGVSLTVTGPGGSYKKTRAAYITVHEAGEPGEITFGNARPVTFEDTRAERFMDARKVTFRSKSNERN